MPLLFERQERESAKAFAAFSIYLNLGPERSLAAVGKKLGKSKALVERWSAKFDWPARVAAHAAHLAAIERLAIEALAVEKAVEWHRLHEALKREAWREAEETIAMVRKAREDWLVKGRVPGWEGMARMLELAFKLKQFAAGLAMETVEQKTQVDVNFRIEVEAAVQKAYGNVVDVEPVKELNDAKS